MLESKIEALTKAIDALTAQLAAASSEVSPVKATVAKVETVGAEPISAAAVVDQPAVMSMDELTRAALALSREGKGDLVRAKLAALGATRISLLAADQVAEFQAFIKGLSE